MGLHFLVVDDSDLNLSCTHTVLKKNGVSCDLVTSPEEAYKLLAMKKYDLVLLDYLMPGTNGIMAAAHIRRMEDGKNPAGYFKKLPIIALTAEDDKEQQQTILESDYDDLVTKPFKAEGLSYIIAKWCKPKSENIKIHGIEQDVLTGMLSADEKGFFEVITIFDSDTEGKCKRINDSLENKDFQSYTVEVHRLKSEAKIIGAMALSQAAASLEAAGKSVTKVTSNGMADIDNIKMIIERTPRVIEECKKISADIEVVLENRSKAEKEVQQLSDAISGKSAQQDKVESDSDRITISSSDFGKLERYVQHALESLEKKEYDLVKEWLEEIAERFEKLK